MLLDTVIALEFCYLLSVEGAALGYALDDRDPNNDVNEVWVAFRVASVYVGYVSVLLHGLVLAIIDEGQFMSRTYRGSSTSSREKPFASAEEHEDDITDVELGTALIPRGSRGALHKV